MTISFCTVSNVSMYFKIKKQSDEPSLLTKLEELLKIKLKYHFCNWNAYCVSLISLTLKMIVKLTGQKLLFVIRGVIYEEFSDFNSW